MNLKQNRILNLFNIQYPIIQGGMVWTSGWRLASAVSNAGGLGIVGAASMNPEILDEHLTKMHQNTNKPFAVNIPLIYSKVEDQIDIILKHKVPIVFTSAGSPKLYTQLFKNNHIKVVHVVSSSTFALKAQEAGCDAVVAEGFEAGGHNGREETTSLCLIPQVLEAVTIPVIAAGGFATGRQLLAALVLGAEAVQFGTRFLCSYESSCHIDFKKAVIESKEGDTKLLMKNYVPVRLLKNKFSEKICEMEKMGLTVDDVVNYLGKGRAKRGMFEGDMDEGELEIGQISSFIKNIKNAQEIVKDIWDEFNFAINSLKI